MLSEVTEGGGWTRYEERDYVEGRVALGREFGKECGL